jgi:flagellar operon protein
MTEMNGVRVPFIPIVKNTEVSQFTSKSSKSTFDDIFQSELDKVKFSSHALKRLESRNISISENDLSKIQNALERAESKGAKDSLIMMDSKAFIVNIPNRTIVTAMDVNESKENVFTNIDSVVFA